MMRLVMMGTGTFAEPTLDALLAGPDEVVGVFTQPDRDTGTKRGSTRQVGRGMKEIAGERNIPVFQPESVNTPEGVAMLRGLSPDLLVVAAYGQILSTEVLGVPTAGAINVHGSLLPRYRGAAPVAAAILNGETEAGVTIIRISAGLDAGDMLAKGSLPVNEDTAGELEARLAPLGAQLAVETIARMKQGPVTGEKQDKALVTKAPKLKKEDGLIDWSKPAGRVVRQIRAMQPWPTAYTFLHRVGKPAIRLMITRASEITPTSSGMTGSMFVDEAGMLVIRAGENTAVQIVQLQPAGKKRMPSKEFLRGHPCGEDDRVGPEESHA
ncbi:methionyl-tRNA formyltransferase [Zavarzinella formosa]|uniref:methionyl-tRNA formyltransferase n=1 Tax=Zavarzinella formosa TaxID=360055 RepID=UPI0004958731|nr:methionyl-tRNA formyltransferase [Zavarzinella formosa]